MVAANIYNIPGRNILCFALYVYSFHGKNGKVIKQSN